MSGYRPKPGRGREGANEEKAGDLYFLLISNNRYTVIELLNYLVT
jgi:hypothetical protein